MRHRGQLRKVNQKTEDVCFGNLHFMICKISTNKNKGGGLFMKTICVYGYMPFEHESDISTEEVINENLFCNNVGNNFFYNGVVKSLMCDSNALMHFNECLEKIHLVDRFVIPFANNIRNGDVCIEEYKKISKVMAKTDAPFIIAGVGTDSDANYNVNLDLEIRKIVHDFYTDVLRRTPTIGVRGEHTKKTLVDYCDIEGSKIDVIGCPSVRYHGTNLPRNKSFCDFSENIKIAVHFTAYHYDLTEAVFLHKLLKQQENSYVIFTDKVEGELLLYDKKIEDDGRIRELLPSYKEHFILREGRARFFPFQNEIMGCLSTFDFTIGSRIHMTIASILSGTPAILIAHSTRVKEIAEYHHIPYILREELEKKNSVELLYYIALARMNEFYTHYSYKLNEYTDFLSKNGLDINPLFKI